MRIRATWAGTVTARGPRHAALSRAPHVPRGAACTADEALTSLYGTYYRPLVRLAALLVQDTAIAEDITQAAFVAAVHEARNRLADPRIAVAYLRRALVNQARAACRRRPVADGGTRGHRFEREPVVVMLGSLPDRQREALVLRYYGGLSEAEAAAAMGVSKAALRRHAIAGMAALRRSWLND